MKKGWRQVGACLPAELTEAMEIAAAEQGNAATALAPAARRVKGGDEPSGGRSPSPMHASREGGSARAMGMEKAGAEAPASSDREAFTSTRKTVRNSVLMTMKPSPQGQAPRPVMRVVSTGMALTRARYAPSIRPMGVARVSAMLVLVWDADRHSSSDGAVCMPSSAR